ncbi:MAG: hypothetical protein GX447_03860 [Elusimicrobia bacterium]|nr:hypothetical protein [Elusimicrobiota bacterium]
MKTIIAYFVFFSVIAAESSAAFLPEGAFSADARGTAGASFLKNISSPKYYALGESGSPLPVPEGFLFNPGSQYCLQKNCIYAAYQSLYFESSRGELSWTYSRDEGFYSFAFLSQSYGTFDKLNSKAEKTGSFSPSDRAFVFSKSFNGEKLNWGLSFKLVQSDLIFEKGWSAALDAGLVSLPLKEKDASYSLYFRNLGPPMKIGSHSDPLPFEAGIGVLKPYEFLNISAEIKFPSYDNPYVAFGTFAPLFSSSNKNFELRAGFNPKNKKQLGWASCFSAGFGLISDYFQADYAYVPYGDLGDTHRFSFSYFFGKKKSDSYQEKKFRTQTLNRMFFSDKKFAAAPLLNLSSSEYRNLGSMFAGEISSCLKEKNYNAQTEDSPYYGEAESYLPESPKLFCERLKADYCIYGTIKAAEKKMYYEISVYDHNKQEDIKKFILESPSSYDFKKAAYKACSYILED